MISKRRLRHVVRNLFKFERADWNTMAAIVWCLFLTTTIHWSMISFGCNAISCLFGFFLGETIRLSREVLPEDEP